MNLVNIIELLETDAQETKDAIARHAQHIPIYNELSKEMKGYGETGLTEWYKGYVKMEQGKVAYFQGRLTEQEKEIAQLTSVIAR